MAETSRTRRLAVVAALLVGTGSPVGAQQPNRAPLPEASHSPVGYETVAEALAALRSRSGVIFTTENNWLIATDEAAYTIWSFAPRGYPAYPAVVKRQVVSLPVGSRAEMSVLCEASKEACDNLVRTFAQINGMSIAQ